MPGEVTLTIEGVDETQRKLYALGVAVNERIVRDALADSIDMFLPTMEELVPVGKTRELRASLTSVVRTYGDVQVAVIGPSVRLGNRGLWVEKGTRMRISLSGLNRGRMPPHPFVQPAFEINLDRAVDRIADKIGVAVEREAAA